MDTLELAVRTFLHYEAHGPRLLANQARRKMEEILGARTPAPTTPDPRQLSLPLDDAPER